MPLYLPSQPSSVNVFCVLKERRLSIGELHFIGRAYVLRIAIKISTFLLPFQPLGHVRYVLPIRCLAKQRDV